jgi:hemolysin activation/secretion protein
MNIRLLACVLALPWAIQVIAEDPVQPLPDLETILPADLGLWRESDFLVQKIELRGNTLLEETDVQKIISQYEQRRLTTRDLQLLRERLTRAYIDRGYISSGVIIPDQPLAGGSIYLKAVEGELNTIVVTRDKRLRSRYVNDLIGGRTRGKLNISQLQTAIQLLQQDPRIQRVAAELVPGDGSGESELRVSVTEAPAWFADLSFDNYRAESVGAERFTFSVGHLNMSGRGDELALSVGESRGSTNVSFNYRLPVTHRQLMLGLVYDLSDASVLEAPFNTLDVESKTEIIGVNLTWPIYRELAEELSLTALLETRESETKLLGRSFSLSPGALDGVSKVAVAGLRLDWLKRSEQQVLALRLTRRQGFDALDATDTADNPFATIDADGDFVSWLAQAQYILRLTPGSRINLGVTAQLARDPLLSVEKFAIGGAQTVRGVRENFMVRDNGVVVNLSVPVSAGRFTIAPFVDYGVSWDDVDTAGTSVNRDTSEKNYIASAGLSLVCTFFETLVMDVSWADVISDNFSEGEDPRESISDKGLQDYGWHFRFSYKRRF